MQEAGYSVSQISSNLGLSLMESTTVVIDLGNLEDRQQWKTRLTGNYLFEAKFPYSVSEPYNTCFWTSFISVFVCFPMATGYLIAWLQQCTDRLIWGCRQITVIFADIFIDGFIVGAKAKHADIWIVFLSMLHTRQLKLT